MYFTTAPHNSYSPTNGYSYPLLRKLLPSTFKARSLAFSYSTAERLAKLQIERAPLVFLQVAFPHFYPDSPNRQVDIRTGWISNISSLRFSPAFHIDDRF
ncbi:hypothetical protein AVEN_22630-1 [Araneus ventricosus]|uniref:Uncharacterized protein n=1 Tax=Araneus ventricosus TaxID=182803 RepID=A0A4Y2QX20_ARAVE|nr:hypothetical protein AVEN_22630-1 [Araneus ventricosus]